MASKPPEEDLDENISVTSTDDGAGGPEEDFFVTKILAEREVNGEPVYLIEWQDLPLAEATWEPRENLSDALMAEWEQAKADQRKGLVPRFKIQEWKNANIQHYESRLARHRLRNIVRERRGLPQTAWTRTLNHLLRDLADFANDEDDQNDEAETNLTTKSLPQSPASDNASTPMNLLESRVSEPSAQTIISSSERVSQEYCIGTSDGGGGREGVGGARAGGGTEGVLSLVEKSALDHPSDERPVSEDVEVTIPKPHRDSIQPSKFSCELPKRPSIPSRAPAGGSAKSAGYANVFAGGLTRKGRGTLSEAASNPEQNPKFLNLRLTRKIELQRRNKEGLNPPAHRPSALISLDRNNPQATIGGQQTTKKAADNASTSKNSNGESTSPKKNGIVQWEDEAMEMDPTDSLFVSEHLPLTPRDTSNQEAREPGAEKEEANDPTTISKTVQVGPGQQDTVTISFEGVPSRASSPWATQFCSDDRLIFTHTCTAQAFSYQINKGADLSRAQLCKGTALSFTENIRLSNLADNLRLANLGLLCSNERYYVVLFPNSQATPNSDKITLEYTIFEPLSSLGSSMLAPAPRLRMSNKDIMSSASYPRPLDHVFGGKYEHLLPPDARNAQKHNFFLAFPPRAEQEAAMLSWWLRIYDSNSDVRTSFSAGHWSSFLELPHGTVIIHEDGLWFIRLFPKLHGLLHERRASFSFWMFGRSLAPVPLFGSGDLTVSPLGDVHLQRVFDLGAAYLITPSFLVSEPGQAYTFLKWFWNIHVKNDMRRPRKLVLCAKVDEWMHNLIYEKMLLRRTLPVTASQEELEAAGISDKAIECRNKSFKLLQQLVFDAVYERTNYIVAAPESIDGNDEQSLVNWFGYWSTLNIDQFRRYSVVGSDSQTKVRLSRILRTPNYSKSIITDPDSVESDLTDSLDSTLATSPSAQRPNRDDESSQLAFELAEIEKSQRGEWCPVKLFWFPVGYSTSNVSFWLGDIDPKYKNYDEWFNHFWRTFNTARQSRNSYAGLFYTLDERQASSSRGVHNTKRSPWAVIFRAISPHIRPWKKSEMFIWDIRYSKMLSEGKSFCYSDLLESQQHLIKYLEEKTKGILDLEKVWVGSFGARAGCSALDVTMRWLDSLLGKVRDWIPAPAKEVPLRGWSLATREKLSENQKSDGVAMNDDITKINLPLQEDTLSTPKIIFHPPSGNNQKPYTRCRNRLHQWAREADPKLEGTNFEYVFRPTMDWYSEQCEEGRGFEHIKVVPWESFFKLYKIEEFLHKKG
ncbi:hypothetical protein M441DRAFT_79409 [Trichoderma asperellum CBS 433.97]|uniref:Chromo domain-containing protein n=1 Tax=Trichoderma asperellum (strain ATCC 204424 / CBS 433.97 / NBRC 101777) TaxID=1042311 RepID=A0A2T3Z8U8_TRIA4|nr:hypothetical protein M441DRAFT_79409 [Trichoderma asperellum CBS 433.97]PTB41227.1 hypothetical protein M441DRAFT_79409 [Trichoderma asperellum CBS 433.97]